MTSSIFFSIKTYIGYSLEAPWLGTFNEYPLHMFFVEKWRKLSKKYNQIHLELTLTCTVDHFFHECGMKKRGWGIAVCLKIREIQIIISWQIR